MRKLFIKLIRKTIDDWEAQIEDNTHLFGDLHFDELDSVELLMECEAKFNVSINYLDWDRCKTVKEFMKLLECTVYSVN